MGAAAGEEVMGKLMAQHKLLPHAQVQEQSQPVTDLELVFLSRAEG